MKKTVIATLLSVLISTPALADNTGQFYVAADLGSATYNNLPGAYSNPDVIRIAGGYHFSPVFAVELGYSMFGDSNTRDPSFVPSTISASSFQIAAVGTLPLSRQFDLIAKVALADNYEDFSDADGAHNSFSRSDLLIGFGAQFNVNSQISVRALYDNYGKFDNFFPPLKATSVSLGVVYNFY